MPAGGSGSRTRCPPTRPRPSRTCGAAARTSDRCGLSLGSRAAIAPAAPGDRHIDRRIPGVVDADVEKKQRGGAHKDEPWSRAPPHAGGAGEHAGVGQRGHAHVPHPTLGGGGVHGLPPHLHHHPAGESQADDAAEAGAATERQQGVVRGGEQGGEQQDGPEVHPGGRAEGANGLDCRADLARQRDHDEHQAGQGRSRRSDDDVERVPAGELGHGVSDSGRTRRNLGCGLMRGQSGLASVDPAAEPNAVTLGLLRTAYPAYSNPNQIPGTPSLGNRNMNLCSTVAVAITVSSLGCGRATPTLAQSPAPASPTFDRSSLDTTCAPCRDFFQFANGGWLARTEIPGEFSSWGSFNELYEHNLDVLHDLLEAAARASVAPPGSNRGKLGRFYGTCMDSAAAEAAASRPLQPELDRIGA